MPRPDSPSAPAPAWLLVLVLSCTAQSLVPVRLAAQAMPLATLSGEVTDADGTALASVAVRVTCSAHPGERSTTTGEHGEFVLAALPPGDCHMAFDFPGTPTAERDFRLKPGETLHVGQVLAPEFVESVMVSAASVRREPEVAFTLRADLVERLPSGRAVRDFVLLAPGVADRGPKGAAFLVDSPEAGIQISGALSYDNLYLVDGVVVSETIHGDPMDLYVEGGIAEATVETGRISAEYGRFTGGVVNVVTRGGGSRTAGSFRTDLANPRWSSNNRFDRAYGIDAREDRLVASYEATVGFPVVRDRLWAFAAGRLAERHDELTTVVVPQPDGETSAPRPYDFDTRETRFAGKLTAAATKSANLIVSYAAERVEEGNWSSGPVLSADSVLDRVKPSSLLALHFDAMLGRKASFEAQRSRRGFTIEQRSSGPVDRIGGTHLEDFSSGGGYGSPALGGQPPLRFENDSWHAKAGYLLATERLGTHDLRVGYEWFRESSFKEFKLSRSDYWVRDSAAILRGDEIFPVFGDGGDTLIFWFPLAASAGWTRLGTESAFFNDRLQLGRRWSANLGLRYDRNDSRAADGSLVSTSAEWSPRLALRWDSTGDGRLLVDAGYARYVSKIHDNMANSASPAGHAGVLSWVYRGPCINCDPTVPTSELVPRDEALRQLFAWFDSIGGVASPPTAFASFPGVNTRLESGGLRSPAARELSLGVAVKLGDRGSARADLVRRDYEALYAGRLDRSTGYSPPDPFGNVYDLEVVGNSDELTRTYTGLQAQLDYRFGSGLSLGGSYTWSRLEGDSIGELGCCAAYLAREREYPEYREARWNHPVGALVDDEGLSSDRRHRARIWLTGERPLGKGRISAALLESLDSGVGYQAVGPVDSASYVGNLGYAQPPFDVAYYFSRPGAHRTEWVTCTDLALTWSVPLAGRAELFVDAQIFNLFDEGGVVGVDTTVETALSDPSTLHPFDPFHETPVEGVHYRLGSSFGRPRGPEDYQRPRALELSIGLRF